MSAPRLAALVLVGGFGTRLHPLTFTRSKPLVDFCNKPMMEYMIEALKSIGVTRIVLALSELQNDLQQYIQQFNKANPGVELISSIETEPLGTAGPLILAKRYLQDVDYFFMLNSDVISPYPFKELLDFHMKHPQAEGTIMRWHVQDASRFGVIDFDSNRDDIVTGFREKPGDGKPGDINAGHYILCPQILDRVVKTPCSIEREIFPVMATEGKLFTMELTDYWMDIGTPEAFLEAIPLGIKQLKPQGVTTLGTSPNERIGHNVIIGQNVEFGENIDIGEEVVIGDNVKIGDNVVIGNEQNGNVVIGPNCIIGDDCHLANCAVLTGSVIGKGTEIVNSTIGWHNSVKEQCQILDSSITGENVVIQSGSKLTQTACAPHITIKGTFNHEGLMWSETRA